MSNTEYEVGIKISILCGIDFLWYRHQLVDTFYEFGIDTFFSIRIPIASTVLLFHRCMHFSFRL